MRVLLDQNVPLALERRLQERGYVADHLVTHPPPQSLYELTDEGEVIAWDIIES